MNIAKLASHGDILGMIARSLQVPINSQGLSIHREALGETVPPQGTAPPAPNSTNNPSPPTQGAAAAAAAATATNATAATNVGATATNVGATATNVGATATNAAATNVPRPRPAPRAAAATNAAAPRAAETLYPPYGGNNRYH
jgi:hypothetical protein